MEPDDEVARRDALVREAFELQTVLSDLLVGHAFESLARTTLTAQQMQVLAVLLLGGERPTTELAVALHVSGATISGVVDRLVGAGLIERRTDPTDGRVRLVSATPVAAAMLRDLVNSPMGCDTEVLEQLTAQELEHLVLASVGVLRVLRQVRDVPGAGAGTDRDD